MALYGQSELGETAIGAGPFPAATFMRDAVAVLRQSHPALQLRVDVGNWVRLLEQLRAEVLEFFVAELRANCRSTARCTSRRSGSSRAASMCAGPIRARERAGLWPPSGPRASPRRGFHWRSSRRWRVCSGCRRANCLHWCWSATTWNCCARSAFATDTVVGLTEAAAAADVAAGRLRRVNPEGLPPLHAHMGLVRLQGGTPSPAAERAMAEVVATCRPFNLPSA